MHEDNIHMEGQFDSITTSQTDYTATTRGDRYSMKKPVDNLKQEGPFYKSPEKEVQFLF